VLIVKKSTLLRGGKRASIPQREVSDNKAIKDEGHLSQDQEQEEEQN